MIDRCALVSRHNPRCASLQMGAPLSVGNGRFAFTADFTGLQTFFDEYAAADDAFPLCTMAEWGWNSYPALDGELRMTAYDTYGRNVFYATDHAGQEELFMRTRHNAHKFHLGKIAFQGLSMGDCAPVEQTLSLWEGVLHSEFSARGEKVRVETFAHPDEDALHARIDSSILTAGALRVAVDFPYSSHRKTGADFGAPEKHSTKILSFEGGALCVERDLGSAVYHVEIAGSGFSIEASEEGHCAVLTPSARTMEFSVRFAPVKIAAFDGIGGLPAPCASERGGADGFGAALEKCKKHWEGYWRSGGALDLSGSGDARAHELERRIVLSQYLIAIQSRGFLPPAETGHTCNSWYGKFHLEMYYWHHAFFPLWGRAAELKRTLAYYKKILPVARELAREQGYSGARWTKMCDPSGRNTPSSVAVLLIWQQPHPIMLAELCHRAEPDAGARESFLREYREIVVETAEFMKSFVRWDEAGARYVVGPPYIPAQERHDPRAVLNAPYELEYFRWGLRKADEWLERLGEEKRGYADVAEKLASPARKDGAYLAHENCPDTFSALPFYTDHPSMLAMYGVLDSDKIDREIMSATLDKVLAVWDKKTFYGWDFPVMAMTACRLGRLKDAIDILLMESPKNTYLANGHNMMVGDDALPAYLPGNGGLLIAAAMLAAGFGEKTGPSFPEGFVVKTEGISAYI